MLIFFFDYDIFMRSFNESDIYINVAWTQKPLPHALLGFVRISVSFHSSPFWMIKMV